MTQDELKNIFNMIEDDDEKFSFIIDLGKQLPPYPQDKKNEAYAIYGCSSNVWFNLTKENDKYYFDFESDALIVKGLLYIIKSLFDGKKLEEIKKVDAMKFFDEIGLKSILSNQRQVGLSSIISRIQNLN